MTREEAILHMAWRREELKNSVSDLDEDIKAFDMAIEALEQEPCEDAISRKYIQENYAICADMLHPDADIVMAWVDEAPPVRVEKKIGQWIPYCYQNCKCSVCGYIISEYDTEEFNFCPNCGDRKK